jgi:hypothetical protein
VDVNCSLKYVEKSEWQNALWGLTARPIGWF